MTPHKLMFTSKKSNVDATNFTKPISIANRFAFIIIVKIVLLHFSTPTS